MSSIRVSQLAKEKIAYNHSRMSSSEVDRKINVIKNLGGELRIARLKGTQHLYDGNRRVNVETLGNLFYDIELDRFQELMLFTQKHKTSKKATSFLLKPLSIGS